MTYEEFIAGLNSGIISKINFFVQDYSHYKSCIIERYEHKTVFMGREVSMDIIEVRLTNDNSERYKFWDIFQEDAKLFRIGKQTYNLKQIWNKITITEIQKG